MHMLKKCIILNKYFLEYCLRRLTVNLTLLFLEITAAIGAVNDIQAMTCINHVHSFPVLLVEADDLIKHS